MKNKILCLSAAVTLILVSCKEDKTQNETPLGEITAQYEGVPMSDEYDA